MLMVEGENSREPVQNLGASLSWGIPLRSQTPAVPNTSGGSSYWTNST